MNIDNKYNSSHNISGEDVLVSVIMPVYNTARYLDRAIGSVLKQNYSNWELICIDDKSEDDSLAILRKYEANPRIKVIANDVNCGQGMARNVGIFHATGKFLCFLDSDDYYARVYETHDVVKGHTYRVKGTFMVWEGSASETEYSYSPEITA